MFIHERLLLRTYTLPARNISPLPLPPLFFVLCH